MSPTADHLSLFASRQRAAPAVSPDPADLSAAFGVDVRSIMRRLPMTADGSRFRPTQIHVDPNRPLDAATREMLLESEPRGGTDDLLTRRSDETIHTFLAELDDHRWGTDCVAQLRRLATGLGRSVEDGEGVLQGWDTRIAENRQALAHDQARLRALSVASDPAEPDGEPGQAGSIFDWLGRVFPLVTRRVTEEAVAWATAGEAAPVVAELVSHWNERERLHLSRAVTEATVDVLKRCEMLVEGVLERIGDLAAVVDQGSAELAADIDALEARLPDWVALVLPDLAPDAAALTLEMAAEAAGGPPTRWISRPPASADEFVAEMRREARRAAAAALAGESTEGLLLRESRRRGKPATTDRVRRAVYDALLNDLEVGARSHDFATVDGEAAGRRTILQLTPDGRPWQETEPGEGVVMRTARLPLASADRVAFLDLVDDLAPRQLAALDVAYAAVEEAARAGGVNALLPALVAAGSAPAAGGPSPAVNGHRADVEPETALATVAAA